MASNFLYDSFDLGRTVIEMGMVEPSAERQFRPSPDVGLRRLHEVDEEKDWGELKELNEWFLKSLFSSKNLTIAVDFTILPHYGEEDPVLVNDSILSGTNPGIKFAVLSFVEEGKIFTLKDR